MSRMDLQSGDRIRRNEIGKQEIGPEGIAKMDKMWMWSGGGGGGGGGRGRHHHIPEEIIEEHIVVKLPVKSLFRFKTVSKSLFNLIKSNDFIYKHFNSSSRRRSLQQEEEEEEEEEGSYLAMCWLIYDEFRCIRPSLDVYLYELRDDTFVALPSEEINNLKKSFRIFGRPPWPPCELSKIPNFKKTFQIPGRPPSIDLYGARSPNLKSMRFVCNCYGTLCFNDSGIIMLVNPFLSEFKRLAGEFLRLGTTYLLGFGFDTTIMDFKVVRMFPGEKIYEVYSLRSNAWRKLDETSGIALVNLGRYDIPCTFFQGKLYWLVLTESGRGRGRLTCWGILTFNLATELFQLMEYPHCFPPNDGGLYSGFIVSNQESPSLAFVFCSKDGLVNLWTLTKVNNNNEATTSWTKLYSIQCSPDFFRPVCFSFSKKHNTFIYQTKVENGCVHLVKYDVMNQSSSTISQPFQIGKGGSFSRYSSLQGLGVCRPSLFSLNSM